MKAIFVLMDTLNARSLSPYGGPPTPHFDRLAAHSMTFDNAYVGSLPCMPARRDLMTGRLNFLHSSWGPMEPFEKSFPESLRDAGVYSRLVTDHYHYWEEGGNGYHTRFHTWECVRGQEGDPWVGEVALPDVSAWHGRNDRFRAQDAVNRRRLTRREDYPIDQVFADGIDFVRRHHDVDDWYLQIESFSPHEPFVFDRSFADGLVQAPLSDGADWPAYGPCVQSPEEVARTRGYYEASVRACDFYLGRLLDVMDAYDLWRDTLLVVGTDHGFLLGEHGWWGKSVQPPYQEVAHVPLFLWHPRHPASAGQRSAALAQWIDLTPTLLDFFHASPLPRMTGRSLEGVLCGEGGRESAAFGYFGGHCCLTDGRYAYFRAPDVQKPLYRYTLAPYQMKAPLPMETLAKARLVPGGSWSGGCPVLELPAQPWQPVDQSSATELYDLRADPGQNAPLADAAAESHMKALLKACFQQEQAPDAQYERYGL